MRKYLVACVLSLIAFVALSQAKDGFIDLSQAKWNTAHGLRGEYEFYWKQLLNPGEFEGKERTYFEFPALWNDRVVDGKELTAEGYATYRLRIILPQNKEYSLYIEDVYCSYRLFLNGKEIASNGVVATNKKDYIPYWKPMFIPISVKNDTNELVLHIANFDHSKGGALEGIEIGDQDYMASKELTIMSYDLLLTGSLIMGGLFFIGLYFFGRHDKSILFFSIFCIVYSYRVIGFGYYVLHSLLDLSWQITTKIEYITLFLSALIFGWFVNNLYPEETKKIYWDIISVISIVFIGITLVTPASVYTLLVEPFFVILLIYLLITINVYIRAKINNRPGSGFALISTGIVFGVFAYNILVYFGLLSEWMAASFWGYILFFISQSLILSYRFAYSLTNAKNQALKASEAKSDFLSTISHEIRTPLNAVVGISHFLLQDNPSDHQKNNLTSLRYSAEHLTTLINDILDYNKLESGTVSFEEINMDLKDTIQSIYYAYQTKAREKELNMHLEYDESIQVGIVADRTRFSQILNNLLDNAIKFTRKGHITLRVILMEEMIDALKIKFEIADTGIGVPEEKQEIIFERFMQASTSTTREFGGTGLGLAIIKKLLELQGSQIKMKSKVNEGSTFWFEQTFKKATGPLKKKAALPDAMDEKKLEGKRVLLVEDNPTNVMVAEKFLTHWKMKMDVAENGVIAIEKSGNSYDIILMDLQMPVMDGYEAARTIRSNKNPVPIVALTASALLNVEEDVLMAGMNDYITKPFDPMELKRKLIKNIL
ncbi:MAG: ATP-binding protein [Marinoscillum sp.]